MFKTFGSLQQPHLLSVISDGPSGFLHPQFDSLQKRILHPLDGTVILPETDAPSFDVLFWSPGGSIPCTQTSQMTLVKPNDGKTLRHLVGRNQGSAL